MLHSALLLAPLCPSPHLWNRGNYICHGYIFPSIYPAKLPAAISRLRAILVWRGSARAVVLLEGRTAAPFIAPRAVPGQTAHGLHRPRVPPEPLSLPCTLF